MDLSDDIAYSVHDFEDSIKVVAQELKICVMINAFKI